MEVFPNPMRMYNEQTPNLCYYIEIYNLKSENPADEVKIEVAIANKDGKIEAQKSYTQKRNYESLVEFGSFDVAGFNSGLYTLVFAVTDLAENYSYYTRSNFYVMNVTELTAEQESMMAAFSGSEYMTISEKELNEKIEQAMYIATEEEKRMNHALDNIESKRMFLFKFWYERERTGYEGLKDEYYERVDFANDYYAFSNRAGWQSDRGRVYIVYGKPDEIDRHPQNPDRRPYVVWTYHNLEGGAKFLFMDNTGFGDYRLVTSTLRGEIYDAVWDELLYKQ
jgi:GWxTD domain-containing protein